MGSISVLSLKKKMDGKGEYFEVMIDLDGQFTRCFLRSGLGRYDLLRQLYTVTTIEDLYQIDDKAILYIA
ncbi:hypothetical protein EIZ39_01675 [Ammoniphilus sp. CFH 90114]|nr:hypothetical protein EIZ39_01675 [Ammoniphilus sp. CFH 90114]